MSAQIAGSGWSELGETPHVERDIVFDMIKRAVWVGPVLIGIATAIWGWKGGASTAFAMLIVVVNFLVAGLALGWAARTSPAMLLGVSLFGYLVRLGLITVAVLLVKDQAWVKLVPLGLALIVTHLGLLFWELRFVSASLAFPGLRPKPSRSASVS